MVKLKRSSSVQYTSDITLESALSGEQQQPSHKSTTKSFFSKFSPTKKGDSGKAIAISDADFTLGSVLSGNRTQADKWYQLSIVSIEQERLKIQNERQLLEAQRKARSISLESEQEARAKILEYDKKMAALKFQEDSARLDCNTEIQRIHNNKIAKLQENALDLQESILLNLAHRAFLLTNSSTKSLPELPPIEEGTQDERLTPPITLAGEVPPGPIGSGGGITES
jgi:hypothetical protein